MGLTIDWDKYNKVLQEDLFKVRGRVVNVVGLTTESKGPQAKLGDICLISSRNGGTEEKPVGLVYIGCSVNGKTTAKRCVFDGNRMENRQHTVETALEMLVEALENLEK